MGMNCGRVSRLFSAYIDGELSGVEMLEVRNHLRSCPACQQEIESLRGLKTAMSRLQPVRASAGAEARLMERIRVEQTPAGTRLREWLDGRVFGRFQPAAVAIYACAGLLLVALGHLPQDGEWSDNYAAHQPPAAVVPAAFSNAANEPAATPVTVAVVNQTQSYGPPVLGDAQVSNAFAVAHVWDMVDYGGGGR